MTIFSQIENDDSKVDSIDNMYLSTVSTEV